MRTPLLLLSVLPIMLCAQSDFAPVGAIWTYGQGSFGGPDSNVAEIEVVGDTTIAGRTCSRLAVNTGWFICHEFVPYLTTSGDSLLYWNTSTSEYLLLFNWASTIGDTWSTPVTQTGPLMDTLDWTVTDTGHVLINGSWLKRFEVLVMSRQSVLFSPNTGTVIERLGGMTAPFTWVFAACDAELFMSLRCYSDPDITWLNPQFPQCELSVGIAEQHTTPLLTALPTLAATGEPIHLTCDRGLIELFDAAGRTMLERTTSGFTTLELERPGTYLLRFTSRNGEVAHEWIVVY